MKLINEKNIIRKDDKLENTINNIKKKLNKKNIKIKRYKTKNINHSFYSSRIELKNFYDLGVNGKGLSKKAAIASSYGELMERIQTGFLINKSYLSKKVNNKNFKDEIFLNINSLKFDYTNIFEDKKYQIFLEKADNYNVVSDFIDYESKEKVLLPIKLINAVTHTNGLCAGNSKNEALCQGICEILERYCYHQIIIHKKQLKNVIIDENEFIFKELENIKKMGYIVKLKDCSLNKFPVIGVYIENPTNNTYLFTMASDTNINIAIQRCITELFQGLSSKKHINKKMKPLNNNYNSLDKENIEINWFRCYNSNNGIHPNELFNSKKTIHYTELPFNNSEDNNSSLTYLINNLYKNNRKIYYKEYSQFNFKSYRIYIPGLSEIDKIHKYEYDFLINKNKIEKVLFNLNDSKKSDIKSIIKILEKIYNKGKYKMMDCGTIFHSKHYIKTNLNNLSLKSLYILLNIKINNNINDKLINSTINNIKYKNKFEYITKNNKIIFPTCPNCNKCCLKNNCKYNDWKKLINKI